MNSNNQSATPTPTNDGHPRRTYLDVIRVAIRQSLGAEKAAEFEREVMPQFSLSPRAHQELTETEYQSAIKQVQKELPYFVQWLMGLRF